MENSIVKMSLFKWFALIKELRKRGEGRRESGAFLLGKKGKTKITHFVCFDDLDPEALYNGIIKFSSVGFINLSKYCKERRVEVKADVHTHPGEWTEQSKTDMDNPMIRIPGHTALIVPNYAQNKFQLYNRLGIYEYKGNQHWITKNRSSLKLTLL